MEQEKTAGRIFLRRAPTDMRKSFDGLSGIVRGELGRDPKKNLFNDK